MGKKAYRELFPDIRPHKCRLQPASCTAFQSLQGIGRGHSGDFVRVHNSTLPASRLSEKGDMGLGVLH